MKNRLLINFSVLSGIFVAILIVFFLLINFYFEMPSKEKLVASIFTAVLAIADLLILGASYFVIKRKREDIKKSFDYFVENQISNTGVGAIIYNNDSDIIWTSKFIEHRLGTSIIGKKITSISEDFANKYMSGDRDFKFALGEFTFKATIDIEHKTIVLKDITVENTVLQNYMNEKLVIGELEIDNMQQFQVTLSEEELFSVQSTVIKMLDELVKTYNLIYKQYVNGKYIFYTNSQSLDKMVKSNFAFLEELKKVAIAEGVYLSASLGIGSGTAIQKTLSEMARDGLRQAQARGGDQVCLMELSKKPKYFGSTTEIAKSFSRVKIKQTTMLFETKLSSPEIERVVIYGHKNADLDAIGSALGIFEIAKAYKKEVYIQNKEYDSTTADVIDRLFSKEEQQEVFIKPSTATRLTNAKTLVVIVDTAELHRIENPEAITSKVKFENVFVFDHHRVSALNKEIPQTNIYIDTSASSASEIITEVINFMQLNIKVNKKSAQFLLNGIYLDTKNFTKATSSRTYQAASFLENFGASSAEAANVLKIPHDASKLINSIMTKLTEVKPGYFMATYDYEVPVDVISMAADEILRTKDRKAAFVIAKVPNRNAYKLSARGIDTNVQKIVEEVGGGGHFAAAAAESDEPLAVFEDNVRQAIVSKKGDE